MRNIVLILFVLFLACEAFAYWGLKTASGRRAFDEMAGIIPLAVGVLGALFVVAAAFVLWRSVRT